MNPYTVSAYLRDRGPALKLAQDADEPDWRDAALCAEVDPEIFFPEKGGSINEAVQVCRSCVVRESCLRFALDNEERFGIWGGFSEQARRRVSRARRAGRSLADIIADDDAEFYARQEALAEKRRRQDRDRYAANRAAVAAAAPSPPQPRKVAA